MTVGKIGSLFDGSGGFPLAGYQNGFTPVWASEVEPYPIRVTKERFPGMKHLGSVTEINGAEIEPVDVITFGSPCQDLSIAGKQKGIHDGARSSLFFQAVRIIKEMRENDRAIGRANEHIRPRFAVWENVSGAYSSNGGRDFQAVLQALCEIADPAVSIPFPQKGKWANAGCIVGDGYSIAWRTYDAKYWPRTPQRRKRIYLIADFAGERAGEILFERESVPGHPEPGGKARKGAAPGAESGAGTAGERVSAGGFCMECSANTRSIGYREGESPTLRAGVTPGVVIEFNPTDSRIRLKKDDLCQTLCSRMGTGGNQVPLVFGISADQNNAMLSDNPHSGVYEADISRTLDCNGGSPACNQGGMMVVEPVYAVTTGEFTAVGQEQTPPLMARDWKDPPVVGRDEPAYALDRACFSAGQNAQYNMNIGEEKTPTLKASNSGSNQAPDVAYSIEGNIVDRSCAQNGKGWSENQSPTLNTIDRHAVCYSPNGNHCGYYEEAETAATLQTKYHYGTGGDAALAAYDCRGNGNGKTVPTLTGDHENRVTDYTALCIGNGQLNQMSMGDKSNTLDCMHDKQAVMIRSDKPPRKWIVRHLTPLECCRLQGFPDGWGDVSDIKELSDEEHAFWLSVRNTYEAINGRKPGKYTKDQMIRWLNKLHTDSAEYKMWGNGIALPCASDVMRRIAKELARSKGGIETP